MELKALREQACEANLDLVRHGLVLFTWGNASARDFERGLMAIKPSGVPYDRLKPETIVVLEVETGKPTDPTPYRPSSDTATHLCLYRAFPQVGGVVHTHSRQATAWAQAGRDLPCLGTTHADYFYGAIPCTPALSEAEIQGGQGYEHNTGEVIVAEFQRRGLDPLEMPAVLVRGHAPFVWGKDVAAAVHNAVVLEEVAGMGLHTAVLSRALQPLPRALLDKHFKRKHGPGAYYGQE